MSEQITEAPADEYDSEQGYPPIGTPEACLIVALDCDHFRVLGHTGRFFHGQINCAGIPDGMIGIGNVPDEHGYWVMENGSVWTNQDHDSGVVDDCGVEGDWRPARLEDFDHFDADVPACMAPPMTVDVSAELNGSVGPLVMCNRVLPMNLTAVDQHDDAYHTHQIGVDFQSFVNVSAWRSDGSGRSLVAEVVGVLLMWFGARNLAKQEGGRVDVMINVAGGRKVES